MQEISGKTDSSKCNFAVTADKLVFSYDRRGKKLILNGITFKVPTSTIYGILGPSGCGKSTLIHCLVGTLKPRSGVVKVLGEVPCSRNSLVPGPGVGYMPQEIGLFDEFTIEETFYFFGRLYRLSNEIIYKRINFLVTFLELPDKKCLVGRLSGGQKRRVSLATTMVHTPPLLVLDEPTVGIDPVLRQAIWRYLRFLTTREGITAIITTHYIDEAQSASAVAFMRHGTILEEGKPGELIERFALNNLEQVFLELCKRENVGQSNKMVCTPHKTNTVTSSPNSTTSKSSKISENGSGTSNTQTSLHAPNIKVERCSEGFRDTLLSGEQKLGPGDLTRKLRAQRNKFRDHFARSKALLHKNVIRMWRDLPVLVFTTLIPVLQCTLFFLCLGHDPYNIPVTVYNYEENATYKYSTRLLKAIDPIILIRHVKSFEDGKREVKDGLSKALFVFPHNYTAALDQKWNNYNTTDNYNHSFASAQLYLDMSSQFHANKIQRKLVEAYLKFGQEILHEKRMNVYLASLPINVEEPLMGKLNTTVTEFMAPGFIMSLCFFSSIAIAALTLVHERKDGLLERSLVAGVNPNEYVLSHVVTQTVVVIIQVFLVLLLAFTGFDLPHQGSISWIATLMVMQGVLGMAYGIMISAITQEENFTVAVCMGSMFPQFLLSGVVWPADTMHPTLVYISEFFSQAKAIEAMRHMLYRGWDPIHHWDVALGFIISASWTLVFLFTATLLFNINGG